MERECESNPDLYFICKGDPAHDTGYIIRPERLRQLLDTEELLPTLKEERDTALELLNRTQELREFYEQRRDVWKQLQIDTEQLLDQYRSQRDRSLEEVQILEDKYLESQKAYAELQASMANKWSPLEVGLLTSGVAILSGLAGAGLYVLLR